jgi:hypothetical protein
MTTTSPPVMGRSQSAAFTVMQRIFDEGFATGDGSVADQVCAPGLVDHQFGLAGTGAEAIQHLKDAIADVHRAVPDICFTIEDSVEQGDASGSGSGDGGRRQARSSGRRVTARSTSR